MIDEVVSAAPTAKTPVIGEVRGRHHVTLDDRMKLAAAMYVEHGCGYGAVTAIAKHIGVERKSAQAWLNRPAMRAYIRELLTQRHNQLELSPTNVLQELATIGFVNVADLFDPDSGRLLEPWELPRHVGSAISAIEIEKRVELGDRKYDRPRPGSHRPAADGYIDDDAPPHEEPAEPSEEITTKKYKFHSKVDALKTLATHYKLIGGAAEDGVGALAQALADKLRAARSRLPQDTQPIEDATIVESTDQPVEPTDQLLQESSDEEPIW